MNIKQRILLSIFPLFLLLLLANCNSENKQMQNDNPVVSNPTHTTEQIETSKNIKGTKKSKNKLIETLDCKITFDGDYNKFITLKFKNNSKFSIIGLMLHLQPASNGNSNNNDKECFNEIHKKMTIAPNQIVTIKEKMLNKENLYCSYDENSLSVSSIVLSNGMAFNFLELWRDHPELMLNNKK